MLSLSWGSHCDLARSLGQSCAQSREWNVSGMGKTNQVYFQTNE